MKESINFENNCPESDFILPKSKVYNRVVCEEDFDTISSSKRLLKETGDGKIDKEYFINCINWRNHLTLKTIILEVI